MTEHGILPSPPANVGAAIRATREERGMSLRALALALGVSPATVSAFERGLAPITVTRLEQVAAVLEVEAADLLTSDPELVQVAPRQGGPGESQRRETPRSDWREFAELEMGPVESVALHLFVAKGFHATTMREIAASARMSVAGVYHHHPSKEHILVALLDRTMSEIAWRLDAGRAEGIDAAESFGLMVESLALFHATRGDLAFLGASEMRGLSPRQRRRITALRDDVQHALDDQALAAVVADQVSHLRPDDVRVSTRAIATMCTALPSWFRPDGPMSAQEVAEHYRGYALTVLGLT